LGKALRDLTVRTGGNHRAASANDERTPNTASAQTAQILQGEIAAQPSRVLVDIQDLQVRLGIIPNNLVVITPYDTREGRAWRRIPRRQ
jgi:hypothetical protein